MRRRPKLQSAVVMLLLLSLVACSTTRVVSLSTPGAPVAPTDKPWRSGDRLSVHTRDGRALRLRMLRFDAVGMVGRSRDADEVRLAWADVERIEHTQIDGRRTALWVAGGLLLGATCSAS